MFQLSRESSKKVGVVRRTKLIAHIFIAIQKPSIPKIIFAMMESRGECGVRRMGPRDTRFCTRSQAKNPVTKISSAYTPKNPFEERGTDILVAIKVTNIDMVIPSTVPSTILSVLKRMGVFPSNILRMNHPMRVRGRRPRRIKRRSRITGRCGREMSLG
jgi:hypothetical protein